MDLRALPSVAALLDLPESVELSEKFSRSMVTRAVRGVLEEIRHEILSGQTEPEALSDSLLIAKVRARLKQSSRATMPRVINATGIILHTNLGRSLLSPAAQDAIVSAATNPVALELNL